MSAYFFGTGLRSQGSLFPCQSIFCDPVEEWLLLLLVGALLLVAANVALCRPMLCCCGPVFRPLCVCLLVRILYERCNLEHRAYYINVEAGFLFVCVLVSDILGTGANVSGPLQKHWLLSFFSF